MTQWGIRLFDPPSGEELALNWNSISITDNFEGTSATIEIAGERPEISFITELRTDVLLFSDKVLAYRLRVMDAEDTFTADAHTVSLTCQSYEAILARRVLFADYETKAGAPPVAAAIGQHEIAWQLISYTQQYDNLYIQKSTDWTSSTVTQNRVIKRGPTIAEAINSVATTSDGFDWWIDQNLKLHAQTPRLVFNTGLDLIWGARVASFTRSSASDLYDSVVMVVGAETDTQIGSTTYPPPPPAIRQLPSRPFGRWERFYTYSDLVTTASVTKKADWHLADSSKRRATYSVVLTPGVWNQAIRPGGLVSLRARSLPRIDFRVPCRIEELGISATPDGAEDVTLGMRAEAAETQITMTPNETPEVPIITTSPPGVVDSDVTQPAGRTITNARSSSTRTFVAIIRAISRRVPR